MDYDYPNRTCFMDTIKKKTIHELAKANPNKTYREVEEMHKAENLTDENNGLVIDDTNECESCQ